MKAMDEDEFEFLEEKKHAREEKMQALKLQENRATLQFQAALLDQRMKTVRSLPDPKVAEAASVNVRA